MFEREWGLKGLLMWEGLKQTKTTVAAPTHTQRETKFSRGIYHYEILSGCVRRPGGATLPQTES